MSDRNVKIYACKSKIKWEHSTSGGMFPLFAEWVIRRNGVVYGAAFDENVNVGHIRVTSMKELWRIQGSKYVVSHLHGVCSQVKKDLEENRFVLFSGTPCQIHTLKRYLHGEDEKVLYLSVICYGVMAQKVWDHYKRHMEAYYRDQIEKVVFRKKSDTHKVPCMEITFQSGNNLIEENTNSFFYQLYYSGLGVSYGCATCQYRNKQWNGDVRLGDYWGIENVDPKFYDPAGVSLVILASEKGEHIFQDIIDHLEYKETTWDEATHKNPAVCYDFLRHPFVKQFQRDSDSMSLTDAYEKHKNHIKWSTKKPCQFTVIGGHTARAVVRTLVQDTTNQLIEHISKTSIISLMSPPCHMAIKKKPDAKHQSFRLQCVKQDYDKLFQMKLKEYTKQSNYFVFDFVEERNDVILCENNSYLTDSDALRELFELPELTKKLSIFENFDLWKESITKLFSVLEKEMGLEKVIILKIQLSECFGTLHRRNAFDVTYRVKSYNTALAERYEYVKKKYPQIKLVEGKKDYFFTDEEHLYGCYPWHLNDYAHEEYAKQILQYVEGEENEDNSKNNG